MPCKVPEACGCSIKHLGYLRRVFRTRHKSDHKKPTGGNPISHIQSLPPELLNEIIDYLAGDNKLRLKTLRFVCRQWAEIAATQLFDTLVVSPSDLNINAFKEVSSHPIYARYVKILVYDGSWFRSDITTLEAYRQALLRDDSETQFTGRKDVEYALRRGKKVFNAYTGGHKRYQQQVEEQNRHLRSPEYQDLLAEGIKNLSGLEEVQYKTFWEQPCNHKECGDNRERGPGLLARSWNTSYLRPRSSTIVPGDKDSRWQFVDLALACSAAGRTVESLIYEEAWYDGSFDVPTHHLTEHELEAVVNLLRPLESLDLIPGLFSSNIRDDDTAARRSKFLQYACNIEALTLYRWNFAAHTGLKDFVWGNLKELHFPESSTNEDELVQFLRAHKSTLRHLCFCDGAFFGKWANVLDAIREHLTLDEFTFSGLPREYLSPLGHRHGYEILCGDLEDGLVTSNTIDQTDEAMEEFALRGGENPLRSDKVKIRRVGSGEILSDEEMQTVMSSPAADPW